MIVNFGSMNIDYVYQLDHIVNEGETITSTQFSVFPGGKGLNQSIALAKAGVEVIHAGCYGKDDGGFLVNLMKASGVNTEYLKASEEKNGHAIIQVDKDGENAIFLYGGTNRMLGANYAKTISKIISSGDMVLFQNETDSIAEMMYFASQKSAKIVLNPSPMDENILKLPLHLVNIFILNEIEGQFMTNKINPMDILNEMNKRFPSCQTVLTLGSKGACYRAGNNTIDCPAFSVDKIVDTTGAGDTFTGYFLAAIMEKQTPDSALKIAAKAAAIAITKMGAATSIPCRNEVFN